ncbi:PDZ domain-containing protein, partial [Streptomyces sp. SID4931]
MSGSAQRFGPRGRRRGAALTLVFGCALATAAATGSLPQEPEPGPGPGTRAVSSTVAPVDHDEIEDAAAEAEADGKSVKDAAEEVVSRSGDRWGAVYDQREYEEFEQALDGTYTGVGLSARRTGRGDVTVSRVQPGGPADRAGIRTGDLLRTLDGREIGKRPVAEVVALLRGDGTGAAEGSRVEL